MNELYNIVREKYIYDEKTGWLIWKNCRYKSKIGKRAGCLDKISGYRKIIINKKTYREHRIIWLWCKGFDTENQIDHINRVKDDNKISNLREATPSCNIKNIGLKSNNKTGIVGVWETKDGKYRSFIQDNKHQTIWLGTFNTLLDGTKARYLGEIEYNYETCNLISTALKYIKDNDPEWLNGDIQVEKNKHNKSSNVKGVCFDKSRNKWISYISVNKERKWLGRFDEFELIDAVMARYKGEVKYNQTKDSQAYEYLIDKGLI